MLLAASIAAAAVVQATTICITNDADEAIGVLVSQEMPDGIHMNMQPADIEPSKETCLTVKWASDRPIILQAGRKSDHSDKSLLTPRCPDIAVGSSARIVVGHMGADLTCVAKEKG